MEGTMDENKDDDPKERLEDQLIEKVESDGTRRAFVGRAAMAAGALVASLFGFAKPVQAVVRVGCCTLCYQPGSCSFTNCGCVWSWGCCSTDQRFRYCRECFRPGGPCTLTCSNVKCSRVSVTQQLC
jgi:hypothetical protein